MNPRAGLPDKVKVGDVGIDGRIFSVGTKPSDRRENNMFAGDWSRCRSS